MSMTENKAIKILKNPTKYTRVRDDDVILSSDFAKAYEYAIQALEEIQQYRAIGTVEELQELKGVITDFPLDCGDTVTTVKEILHQLCEYLKIGTIEEFKALKEKNVGKKPINIHKLLDTIGFCQSCKSRVYRSDGGDYCHNCGQKLDWSEE